jgi:hypothetical protein
MTSANSRQVSGTHYAGEYQHWDLVIDTRLPYMHAQVIRYVYRWRKKGGVQDLRKAKHFIQKMKERLDDLPEIAVSDMVPKQVLYDSLYRFLNTNDVPSVEREIITYMVSDAYHSPSSITHDACTTRIDTLIEEALAAEPGTSYVNQE